MRGEFLDVGGVRLYYYAAGERGAGEPVVLLHGFPTSSHLWGDVVPLLPAGHRVVVLDQLGFGRSDRPNGQPVTVLGHAERVITLMDTLLIERACIVGHDMGGAVAQMLAVRWPTRVSHLGLVDSAAFDEWPVRELKLARAMAPLTRHLPSEWLVTLLRRELARGYVEHERALRSVELYARPFATAEGRDAFVQHLNELDSADTVALASRLKNVVAPTAIVWGADDPFQPVGVAERLREAIPDATLHVCPRVRHFVPEEAPQCVADAISDLLTR